MSFTHLMAHLGTLTRNTMRVSMRAVHRFTLHTQPTSLQDGDEKSGLGQLGWFGLGQPATACSDRP